jgi:hypothetical protein
MSLVVEAVFMKAGSRAHVAGLRAEGRDVDRLLALGADEDRQLQRLFFGSVTERDLGVLRHTASLIA